VRRHLTRIMVNFEQTVSRYFPLEFKDLQTPLSKNEIIGTMILVLDTSIGTMIKILPLIF